MLWLDLLQIKSDDAETRLQAVQRLARSASSSAFKVLAEATHDPDMRVRCAAVTALGKSEHDGATMALLEAMRDPLGEVRVAAADGLKGRSGELIVAVMSEGIRDSDPGVRGRASQILDQLQWRPNGVEDEILAGRGTGQHGAGGIARSPGPTGIGDGSQWQPL